MKANKALQGFTQNYYGGTEGLCDLLLKTKRDTYQIPKKLQRMQSIYLQKNPSLYTQEDKARMLYYLNAFCYKEFLCDVVTEQIWGFVHTGEGDRLLIDVLHNIFDFHQTVDVDTVALSRLLESFLLQGTAFLDFYLQYLCAFFQIEQSKTMNGKKIKKAL